MALAVTVLGSGSAMPSPTRGSAGYLVSVGDEPMMLVDAGDGTLERLTQLAVSPRHLFAVALTHTHIDHSGGLAPVVFAGYMHKRAAPLTVIGPAARDRHPGIERFTSLLFGTEGAWQYLHNFEGFGIDAIEVPPSRSASPSTVWSHGDVVVRAVGVPHGSMPSVAYRIDHAGRSICFSGDIAGAHDGLVELATGADVLVHDQSLPSRDSEHGANHSPPEETAANAARAGVRHLVLSHVMPEGDEHLDEMVRRVRANFGGQLTVARDFLRVTPT